MLYTGCRDSRTDAVAHHVSFAKIICLHLWCVGPRIRRRPVGDGARRRRRRTAFSVDQLRQLRAEYEHSQYISDQRRQQLAQRIGLGVGTVKIWFQNRRASDKKASGVRNELALRLMAEGLYEHHTVNNNNNTTTSALWSRQSIMRPFW